MLLPSVADASVLVLSIPAALITTISRTWYADKMAKVSDSRPLKDFPLLSFASLALTGGAPGGIIADKPMPFARFIYGQTWLLILLAVAVLYVLIKGPAADTFSARFSAVFISQVWCLLVLNLIPLPPFDAAAIYFAPYMQWRAFSVLMIILTLSALVLLSYDFWKIDFLTGKFLLRWLSLI